MKFKLFATDDWLANNKVFAAICTMVLYKVFLYVIQ